MRFRNFGVAGGVAAVLRRHLCRLWRHCLSVVEIWELKAEVWYNLECSEGVLKSEVAIQVSIRLMNVFVAMRRALASIAPVMSRLDAIERRQIADQTRNDENQQRNEERFDTIFKAMDGGEDAPI